MGLPIGTALFGLGTGVALTVLLSHVQSMPDFAPQMTAMIGLGVGIDYALFIVTRYRERPARRARTRGRDRRRRSTRRAAPCCSRAQR